jgi:hypothetical protein
MSLIRIKQIEDLTSTISSVSTGTSLTAALSNYFANSGFAGPTVCYLTGLQTIIDLKTFSIEPYVPTGALNISGAASKLFVKDYVSGVINNYSGWASGEYVSRSLSQTIAGTKTFSSNVFIPRASDTGHAMNLRDGQIISGVLRSGIDDITIENVLYDGAVANQRITGRHIYDVSPYGVTPTHPSGFVTLDYVTGTGLSVGNTVKLTTNQTISGIKTFVNSPVIPIALNANEPVRKSQLDAAINLLVAASGTGNYVGVASVNSQSGRVTIDGVNGIFVTECSGIIYVSGTAANTNLYSVSLPLTSGITGVVFNYATGFSLEPNVVGTLKYAGQGNLQFVDDVILNSTTGGFNVAFSTGIPSTGYYYNFSAIPVSGSSGFLGVKGDRGFPGYNFRQRGQFQVGVQYLPYDVVFTTPNFVSYWTTGTAISDSFNAPSGTGTSLWQILSSGMVGPSGYYIAKGVHNTGTIYNQRDSVTYADSTYYYSGSTPTSGFTPDALTGGWGLVAAKGAIGYLAVSGNITGNFSTVSFFLSPVSTGLDLAESFVGRTFFCTGFALAAVTTGSGPLNGGILTGRLYTRDTLNVKTVFQTFTFNSGIPYFRSGDFSQTITGDHRIGVDILNTLSGIDKFSIGAFGFGT